MTGDSARSLGRMRPLRLIRDALEIKALDVFEAGFCSLFFLQFTG
jgi:hypothetical protein